MTSAQRGSIALLVTAACVAAAIFAPPLAQPLSYHNLADQRTFFGVANFVNVASNLPFVYVGVAGLWAVRPGGRAVFLDKRERFPYVIFFVGVLLTAFGSGHYHLAPGNQSLVWDRLPIAIALMGLLSALLAERVNVLLGRALTMPATVLGLASVWYWQWSAAHGTENVLPYLILQGYTVLMVLLLAALFPPRYTRGSLLIGVFLCYLAGKLFEWADWQVFAVGGLVSGHTLKHLASALATYLVLRMLTERRPLAEARTA